MNDRRFKELVNLHLDHRLSADEANELEQALRADPARRKTLASYATLQQGCSVLCRRSSAGAPAPESILRAIRAAERKASAPVRPRSRVWAWGTWSTATGLAAMAALVVIRVERPAGLAATEDEPSAAAAIMGASAEPAMTEEPVVSAAAPAMASFLPPHLTLAALGISNEAREVGVVSRWSHPLDDITPAELARAASWARASAQPTEWAMDATATSHFGGTLQGATAAQASAASFTFER